MEIQLLNKMCASAQKSAIGSKLTALIADIENDRPYTGALLTQQQIHNLDNMCKNAQAVKLGTVINTMLTKWQTQQTIPGITTAQANLLDKKTCLTCSAVTKINGEQKVIGLGSLINYIAQSTIDTGSQILTFTVPNQIGSTSINQATGDIKILVPSNAVKTNIIATFTTSRDATVKVGTTTQVSGTTPNDFTNAVSYVVTSESGATKTYSVTIINAPAKGDIITLDNDSTKEYLVMDITNDSIKVLAKYNASDSIAFNAMQSSNTYNASDLDRYLTTTFHDTLSTNIKNALVAKDVTIGLYGATGTQYNEDTHASYAVIPAISTTTISRKIYAPDVLDIEKYFGGDGTAENLGTFSEDDIKAMFESTGIFWLSSADSSGFTNSFVAIGGLGDIHTNAVTATDAIKPILNIDLRNIEWAKVTE